MKKQINVGDTKGLVRRFDDLGRIVIPKEFRKQLGLDTKTAVEMFLMQDGLFLRKDEEAVKKDMVALERRKENI